MAVVHSIYSIHLSDQSCVSATLQLEARPACVEQSIDLGPALTESERQAERVELRRNLLGSSHAQTQPGSFRMNEGGRYI